MKPTTTTTFWVPLPDIMVRNNDADWEENLTRFLKILLGLEFVHQAH